MYIKNKYEPLYLTNIEYSHYKSTFNVYINITHYLQSHKTVHHAHGFCTTCLEAELENWTDFSYYDNYNFFFNPTCCGWSIMFNYQLIHDSFFLIIYNSFQIWNHTYHLKLRTHSLSQSHWYCLVSFLKEKTQIISQTWFNNSNTLRYNTLSNEVVILICYKYTLFLELTTFNSTYVACEACEGSLTFPSQSARTLRGQFRILKVNKDCFIYLIEQFQYLHS